VLVTRGFLAITGYPKIGGRSLHIAHLLWGGLLLVLALTLLLTHLGRAVRTVAAVLGGVGFGLFIDEIGKFVTQTNNYFYRPAAALIYVAFVVLVLAAKAVRGARPLTETERAGNAAYAAVLGVTSGLTRAERQAALGVVETLKSGPENIGAALCKLLETVPERTEARPGILREVQDWVLRALTWLLTRRWFITLVVGVFILQAALALLAMIPLAVILAGPTTAREVPELGATVAITVFGTINALIAIIGAIRIRRDRRGAYTWLQTAVVLDILVTQPFNFALNQFGALAALAFDLVVYAVVTHQLHQMRRQAAATGTTAPSPPWTS
jgi:hypothetical protein